MSLCKKMIAEFIGTFVLVVFGCGTAMLVGCEPGVGYLITALAFGLVIVAMAYSIGNVSGCHINPAVSLGVLLSGKMTAKEFGAYVAAQFLGGIAGGALLKGGVALFGAPDLTGALGSNGIFCNVWGTLLVEVLLTFVFVLAVLGATDKPETSSQAGLIIGLSLVLVHILGIGLTGTSVNPARSFGPALFAGGDAIKNVWIFIVAPLVGGALAALVYKAIRPEEVKE